MSIDGGIFQIRILEQNQQKEKSLSLAPPRRKKLDSTDSAESTASSNSNNGGERSLLDGGERSLLDGGGGRNGGHVGHRGRSGRSVKPVPPVLTLPLPNSGQVGRSLARSLSHQKFIAS